MDAYWNIWSLLILKKKKLIVHQLCMGRNRETNIPKLLLLYIVEYLFSAMVKVFQTWGREKGVEKMNA